jgi:hypothetical protein
MESEQEKIQKCIDDLDAHLGAFREVIGIVNAMPCGIYNLASDGRIMVVINDKTIAQVISISLARKSPEIEASAQPYHPALGKTGSSQKPIPKKELSIEEVYRYLEQVRTHFIPVNLKDLMTGVNPLKFFII